MTENSKLRTVGNRRGRHPNNTSTAPHRHRSHSGQMTPSANDVAQGRSDHPRLDSSVFQEQRNQSSGGGARERGRPAEVPGLRGATLDDRGEETDLGTGQKTDDSARLLRPPAPNLTSLTRPWLPESSGYVLSLLRRASVSRCTMAIRFPVSAQGSYHGGENGQLSAVERGQPIRNHFEAAAIDGLRRSKVGTRAPASRHKRAAADTRA